MTPKGHNYIHGNNRKPSKNKKNKQQHYHSLWTQVSLENHNNENTNIYTIINFRHKANTLWSRHHLTHISSSWNQIGLICHEVWRRRNTTKVVTAELEMRGRGSMRNRMYWQTYLLTNQTWQRDKEVRGGEHARRRTERRQTDKNARKSVRERKYGS